MKLIRDIISEKRQLASKAPRESEAESMEIATGDDSPAHDPVAQAADIAPETSHDVSTDDDFAAFFAENNDPFTGEADHVDSTPLAEQEPEQTDQEAPSERPSKLVLGSAFALDPDTPQQPQEDSAALAEEAEPVVSPHASSQEQDTEQSLRDVFREPQTAPDKLSGDDPDGDPAGEAEQHIAELLTANSATEPQQDLAEPAPVQPEVAQEAPPSPVSAEPASVEVPMPAPGRGTSRHGRVKTRLLGFNTSMNDEIDPMKDSGEAKTAAFTKFPVGWLIVVEGEGRGSAFSLFNGVSNIGRGTDQTVCLDFGDNSISRDAHASIAYDPRQQSFFIGHCGKANIVRRNDRPVLSTEELAPGDHITIGETTLRFVPLCGPDFSWESSAPSAQAHAANG